MSHACIRYTLMATTFLFCVATSDVANCQTRKETEEFLVKKIAGARTQYNTGIGVIKTRWDINFKNDKVTITQTSEDSNPSIIKTDVFDIKDIDPDLIELSQLNDGSYQIDLMVHDSRSLVEHNIYRKGEKVPKPLDTYHAQLFNISNEKRTANQLLKSFKHLATLAQPKELFD